MELRRIKTVKVFVLRGTDQGWKKFYDDETEVEAESTRPRSINAEEISALTGKPLRIWTGNKFLM